MTEADPGAARPTAGLVGVHRQKVTEPVTEPESLNAVPQRRSAPTEEDREGEGGDMTENSNVTRRGGQQESRQPGSQASTGTVETPASSGGGTGVRAPERPAEHGRTGGDEISHVREEIERTRGDLGDTIEALAAKADVKARARERVHETAAAARARATGVAGRVREATPAQMRHTAGKVAGKVGAETRRRPGTIAAAGAALTAAVILRRMMAARGAATRRTAMPFGRLMPGRRATMGTRMRARIRSRMRSRMGSMMWPRRWYGMTGWTTPGPVRGMLLRLTPGMSHRMTVGAARRKLTRSAMRNVRAARRRIPVTR
ncbi:DUF3618 domain-containing protein [Microbispora sp. RL4-1S]|uniref:DUF3618 domain-containing protein n=1 Tax=Microbispora oryzae TaxID=2806554 RepID=A0A940WLX9_9ACTN|nr:DUF3618 domain-containing protein [Microbispora oryzae]MBP2705787.1 DUF3618 domain-containing protein [Microbispora oryzae]